MSFSHTTGLLTKLTSVVLGCYIISQVVVQDEAQKTIEQSQIDLLVDLRKHSLHEHVAFTFASLPDIGQVIDALAPLQKLYELEPSVSKWWQPTL